MEKHDSRLRHFFIDGTAFRPPLHPCATKPVLYRSLELERVEGGTGDQSTCDVRVLFLCNSTLSVD